MILVPLHTSNISGVVKISPGAENTVAHYIFSQFSVFFSLLFFPSFFLPPPPEELIFHLNLLLLHTCFPSFSARKIILIVMQLALWPCTALSSPKGRPSAERSSQGHCHGRQRIRKTLEVSAVRGVQTCLNSAAFGEWPQQSLTRHFHSDVRTAVVGTAVCAVSWTAFEYAVEGSSVTLSI